MTAAEIARALGGHRSGAGYVAQCPAHEDRTPSLSITDKGGRTLFRCHAGCSQGDVLDALRSRGLWNGERERSWPPRADQSDYDKSLRDALDKSDGTRVEQAARIWERARPAKGTAVELYLRSRAITVEIPESIRFNRLHHPKGGTHPAMIARVVDVTGATCGLHRTFLTDHGAKAPVDPVKAMLGPCRGSVVRLGPISDHLLIGEGIETTLSAMQVSKRVGWAALSAGNMRIIKLPPEIKTVTLLQDNDAPGRAAVTAAALRFKADGLRVLVAKPKEGFGDFNDELMAKVKHG